MTDLNLYDILVSLVGAPPAGAEKYLYLISCFLACFIFKWLFTLLAKLAENIKVGML